MKRVGQLIVLGLFFAGSLALHILGSELVSRKIDKGLSDIGGNGMTAPLYVRRHFSEEVVSAYPAVILAICTWFGVLSNILFNYSQGSLKRMTIAAFGPLLVSPIVLYSTYAMAITQPDGMVAALMAFQNGFFWQTVLTKRPSARK